MKQKIRIIETNQICFCDYQVERVDGKIIRHYYKSPDTTEEYNPEEIEVILPTPYELFGVECEKGWNKIIQPLFDYIEEYNQNNEDKIIVEQVKEKFGGLRFYVNKTTEELSEMIRNAEHESYKTCEICGSTKDVGQTFGWITTICKNCLNKNVNNSDKQIKWVDIDNHKTYIVNKNGFKKE